MDYNKCLTTNATFLGLRKINIDLIIKKILMFLKANNG